MAREYTTGELAGAIGRRPSTIHRYLQAKLIPRPIKGGRSTRYGEEHMIRVRVIGALLARGMTLGAIRDAFRKRTTEQIAQLVPSPEPPPAAPPPPTAPPPPAAPPSPARVELAHAERWARVPIVPGVDLVVRDDATEFARRVASEIQQRYQTR